MTGYFFVQIVRDMKENERYRQQRKQENKTFENTSPTRRQRPPARQRSTKPYMYPTSTDATIYQRFQVWAVRDTHVPTLVNMLHANNSSTDSESA